MKVLYLESIAGIAGDMFAASFVNAGLVFEDELQLLCEQLGVPGVEIKVSQVIRASMQATHINVIFDQAAWVDRMYNHHSHDQSISGSEHVHVHIPYRKLELVLIHSALPEHTKALACAILDTLAEAEAHCHGVSKDEVSFHELGMLDSLMDVVMAAHCITKVAPDCILASPLKLGRGLISTAHGPQAVPPQFSAALVIDMPISSIPQSIQNENIELSTPTGLAILKTLKPQFLSDWPAGTLEAKGNGAGTMDLGDYPNLFRISLFNTKDNVQTLPYERDIMLEVAINFDDTTSERLAWTTKKLFEYGALDVWQTTAVGKKGRVMIILSFLVEQDMWPKCVDFILNKTSTFGLRYKQVDRLKLNRTLETRKTDIGCFRVKIGYDTTGKKIKEKFEFDDVQKAWDKETHDSIKKDEK